MPEEIILYEKRGFHRKAEAEENKERIRKWFQDYPKSTIKDCCSGLRLSYPTVRKHLDEMGAEKVKISDSKKTDSISESFKDIPFNEVLKIFGDSPVTTLLRLLAEKYPEGMAYSEIAQKTGISSDIVGDVLLYLKAIDLVLETDESLWVLTSEKAEG